MKGIAMTVRVPVTLDADEGEAQGCAVTVRGGEHPPHGIQSATLITRSAEQAALIAAILNGEEIPTDILSAYDEWSRLTPHEQTGRARIARTATRARVAA